METNAINLEDITPSSDDDILLKLRKTAKCVYLAAPMEVADDIATTIYEAMGIIQLLREEIALHRI